MFTIKTSVRPSTISGLGAFSEQFVLKGTTVWEFNPRFDLIFSQHEVEYLPEHQREFIKWYGYLDTQQFNGWYVLHVGNDRFTNHSETPNTVPVKLSDCQYIMIASKDINIGDEITCNYNEYEHKREDIKL
jgi:SET domain-containing protein